MRKVEYFKVYDDFSVDGREPIYKSLCNFGCEKDAYEYAKGKGNYGHNAKVSHEVVFICDNILEATEYNLSERRQAALRKLTAEERKLLGV